MSKTESRPPAQMGLRGGPDDETFVGHRPILSEDLLSLPHVKPPPADQLAQLRFKARFRSKG
jgi:hypothetical protein